MISEFFVNSVISNLELLEKQSLKLNLNILKRENISKQENDLIKEKLENYSEKFSNFVNEKITDTEVSSFVNSKESDSLLNKINDINTLLSNNIKIKQDNIQKSENQSKVYDFISKKVIKDKIKSLSLEYSLKDKNLFKNNKVDGLVALLKVNDSGILNKDKVLSNMEKNKHIDNVYTDNEIKVMSEMSKYLISSLDDNIEAMEPIQVSSRFSSSKDYRAIMKKGGYAEGNFGQYLRGTSDLNVPHRVGLNIGYYAYSCHSNCHSNCHGSRGWR